MSQTTAGQPPVVQSGPDDASEFEPAPAPETPHYRPSEVMELRIDDVVRLRKQHPCGSFDWRIFRLGADIGIRCLSCGHRVLLPRSTLERRIKQFLSRGPQV